MCQPLNMGVSMRVSKERCVLSVHNQSITTAWPTTGGAFIRIATRKFSVPSIRRSKAIAWLKFLAQSRTLATFSAQSTPINLCGCLESMVHGVKPLVELSRSATTDNFLTTVSRS
eukprot:Selendium_serpulae@DN5315_c0_g1_i2.p2